MSTPVKQIPYLTPWDFSGLPTNQQMSRVGGFVYLITFPDGAYYIGKKIFNSTGKTKITDGTKWQNYTSSSEIVKAKIAAMFAENPASLKDIRREVLDVISSKVNLTYAEMARQVAYNVLTDVDSLNANILGKFFKRIPGHRGGCPVTIKM